MKHVAVLAFILSISLASAKAEDEPLTVGTVRQPLMLFIFEGDPLLGLSPRWIIDQVVSADWHFIRTTRHYFPPAVPHYPEIVDSWMIGKDFIFHLTDGSTVGKVTHVFGGEFESYVLLADGTGISLRHVQTAAEVMSPLADANLGKRIIVLGKAGWYEDRVVKTFVDGSVCGEKDPELGLKREKDFGYLYEGTSQTDEVEEVLEDRFSWWKTTNWQWVLVRYFLSNGGVITADGRLYIEYLFFTEIGIHKTLEKQPGLEGLEF